MPEIELPDLAASEALGKALATCLRPGLVIYLQGDLGAGKTTLARALLHALGHAGPVKSPTYALVEVYVVSRLYLYHFDFYRFMSPEEFLDAGLDEYFREDSICLVEWSDKASGYVPPADLVLSLREAGAGRRCAFAADSGEGRTCLTKLFAAWRAAAS
ncbi:MAG: tRNA (adenosine(37)-N6)-threonylcarbamoyltransferase complex ATPase subunit type 1 TsaE [Zoogloeaceae bacterium]|nr:tRNA (adenosine(37)-N6)-threonylcarbamoyltransferase complex ATPase subunit type 1 TsaE [Zoogloeaceae bacterium]